MAHLPPRPRVPAAFRLAGVGCRGTGCRGTGDWRGVRAGAQQAGSRSLWKRLRQFPPLDVRSDAFCKPPPGFPCPEAAAPAGAPAGPPGRGWGAPDDRCVAEPRANGLAEWASRAPREWPPPLALRRVLRGHRVCFLTGAPSWSRVATESRFLPEGRGRPRLGRPGAQRPVLYIAAHGRRRGTPALSEAGGVCFGLVFGRFSITSFCKFMFHDDSMMLYLCCLYCN